MILLKKIKDKIPDITNVATNTTLNANLATVTAVNAKIKEVKKKIPNVNKLATTTAPTAIKSVKYLTIVNILLPKNLIS